MSKTIPILVVVDAESILRDHKANGYTPVDLKNSGRGYVFLMSDWANVDQYKNIDLDPYMEDPIGVQDQQEGGYSLNLKPDVGDIIRWRAVCLSSPFQHRCYLQSLTLIQGWTDWKFVTPPKPRIERVTYACVGAGAGSTAPRRVAPVVADDYWWESVVVGTTRQPYNVQYAIVDSDRSHRGIFSHDPYIT